jgi:hypothetical protein
MDMDMGMDFVGMVDTGDSAEAVDTEGSMEAVGLEAVDFTAEEVDVNRPVSHII